jgi:superfamily II DNA helicase RecQ
MQILFATVALGMGADLGNVTRVYNIGPPTSIESMLNERFHSIPNYTK